MLSKKDVLNFKKKGFIHVKNFLPNDDVSDLLQAVSDKKNHLKNYNFNNQIDDERIWNFVCNKKLKSILSELIGPNVYYLHDANLLYGEICNDYSWHRDNPCRRTGVGPDWNSNLNYNVVSAAVYFSDTNVSHSALNVISKSHNKIYKFSFSNFLRILHYRCKSNKKLFFFRRILEKIIGTELKYKSGDLIIFYCNLFHTGSLTKSIEKVDRECIISRFGGEGIHSKTFMNYELNYRKGKDKFTISKKKEIFFNRLKENNIFISPEVKQEPIDGIHIPRDQAADGIYTK